VPAARVLVTRPQGQQQQLLDALERAGLSGAHLPLIEILPLTLPDARQRQRLLGLCDIQHVIFVSGNAIRYGMALIEDFWPQLPSGPKWYTVGASSARLLQSYGVEVLQPERDMSSEGLLALPALQSVDSQRVLIVKGEGGRTLLRDTLESRGARVEELAVYRRQRPEYDEGELGKRILESGCECILVSSGEGLHNMVSLLDEESLARVRPLVLVVPGERVAEQAREAGFGRIVIADNATDRAMVAAARRALSRTQTG
jgi:uroporphyrinogen-III synthase